MSRCFPYPPPGYALSEAQNKALIESMKLRAEKEHQKAEKQRKKEKGREREERKKHKKDEMNTELDKSDIAKDQHKKEKRREGEEKKKHKKDKANTQLDKSDIAKDQHKKEKRREGEETKKHKKDETNTELDKSDIEKDQIADKLCSANKRRRTEAAHLEHSNLSEEHGHAVGFSSHTSSPDSTGNSNKRTRPSSIDDIHAQLFLTQSPSKRQDEFHDHQNLLSTSFHTDYASQNQGLEDKRESIHLSSTSSQSEETGITMGRLELQYKNLMDNLALPHSILPYYIWPLQDDMDWLFNNKKWHTKSCSRSTALSQDDVCVNALPYVVPY